jgi:uncharacterized protein (DUF924 family)
MMSRYLSAQARRGLTCYKTRVARPEDILEFWFSRPDEPLWSARRLVSPSGASTRDPHRFLSDYEAARLGRHDDWTNAAGSAGADRRLDQFPQPVPRSRGPTNLTQALSWRDMLSRVVSIACGRSNAAVYLPFEHSEDLAPNVKGSKPWKWRRV